MLPPLIHQLFEREVGNFLPFTNFCDGCKLFVLQLVGRKRAPTYSPELRQQVYSIFEFYEKIKKASYFYDTADLVKHVYKRIVDQGYKGPEINYIFRDEVQDCTQGELLLDFR